jgi:hypothetical protein
MAAVYWHFLVGKKTIGSLEGASTASGHSACIKKCPLVFLAGIQSPDINYYPGGEKAVSELAHRGRPADLGRNFLSLAETDEERAYALGWLMHLTTDVITHPLVNRMILENFARKCRSGIDDKAYPPGHHRVEWGVDIYLLRGKSIASGLPDVSEIMNAARHLDGFVSKAFSHTFDRRLSATNWQSAIDSMIRYVGIFKQVWGLTGRMCVDSPGVQLFKDLLYLAVALPVFKAAALLNPRAGVFMPVLPAEKEIGTIREYTDKACLIFLDYLADDFQRLVNSTG